MPYRFHPWAGPVLGSLALLALTACGDDGAGYDVEQATGGDESAPSADAGGGTGGDGDGADETAGADAGAADTGELTAGDESGEPPGQPPEGCDLDCGEGQCELAEDGLPACACPDGSVLVGLTCLACQATMGPADVDIGGMEISLRVEIDHEPAPASEFEDGRLSLRDAVRGDEIPLGNSHDALLGATVLPGSYDLVWARESGGQTVPRNTAAVLGRIQIRPGGVRIGDGGRAEITELDDGTLVVDIPTVEAVGDFRFDGVLAPDTPLENGRVFLLDPATGDEVLLGETRDGTYAVRVIEGEYEVHYSMLVSNGMAPRNHDARLQTIVVAPGEVSPVHSIDIPTTVFAGAYAFDGIPAPPTPFQHGRIHLRDSATGDEIEVGYTSEVDFSLPVVPGPYEIVYTHMVGDTVPRNAAAVVASVDLALAPQVDIDVPTVSVSGAFLVGGAPAPADSGDAGALVLRSTAGDDEVLLGSTHEGSYTSLVVAGEYDIFYAQQTSSGGVPLNTNARIGSASVSLPDEPLGDIDVPFVSVSGAVTLGGAPPPTSEYDDGRIYLRNLETDDSVLLGNTRLGAVSGLVVPGTYDVIYVVETPGELVPQNSGAKLGTIEVPAGGGALDLPIDIPVATLAGAITLHGGAAPLSDADRALLVLEDRATDDVVFLGSIADGAFAVPLTAGTYVVWYGALASSGLIPANTHAGLACFTLTP